MVLLRTWRPRPPAPRTVYLFEARGHAPAAGLHDAVVPAHVLAHLPVLLAPLLPAGQHRRVAEERRNTVTGQSAKGKEGGAGAGESQALAAWPAGGTMER